MSDDNTAPEWIVNAARARGPVAPGHYRVVVVEASSRPSVRDFDDRQVAEQYANDAASEADAASPLAYVFDERLKFLVSGKHYAMQGIAADERRRYVGQTVSMTTSLEFTFKGMPVGEFQGAGLPNAPGDRRYEPFRGPGHYEMQSALKEGFPANCEAVLDDDRVEFIVTACPEYGVLRIEHIGPIARLSDVERAWRHLLSRRGLFAGVRAMIEAASAQPKLRSLFPYLSLNTRLKFSTTTEFPYSEGYPSLFCLDAESDPVGLFELRDGEQRPVLRGDLATLIPRLVLLLPREP